MPFYRFQPDMYGLYDIVEYPPIPDDVSFLAGRMIDLPLTSPLVFTVDHPVNERPKHLLGSMIPVASDLLIETLLRAGADNFQTFPAVLHNPDIRSEWTGYHALNILGLVDAADMGASTYDEIMADDEGPGLVDFRELVFARSKAGDLAMFRLLQNPTQMFIIDRVRDELVRRKPADGWGITTFEVPVRE